MSVLGGAGGGGTVGAVYRYDNRFRINLIRTENVMFNNDVPDLRLDRYPRTRKVTLNESS